MRRWSSCGQPTPASLLRLAGLFRFHAWVNSGAGRPVTFPLRPWRGVPIPPPTPSFSPADFLPMHEPPSEPFARNKRVLVIDDNPAIHADVRKILCPVVSEATASLEALETELLGGPTGPAH